MYKTIFLYILTFFSFGLSYSQSITWADGSGCANQMQSFEFDRGGEQICNVYWEIEGDYRKYTINAQTEDYLNVTWNTSESTMVKVRYKRCNETFETVWLPVTINNVTTPTVTLVASHNNVCQGTPITFTATSANGGSSPHFSWYVNNNPVTTTLTNQLTRSNLNNGDVVKVQLASSASCVSVAPLSNPITMIISPRQTMQVTVTGASLYYAGKPGSFNANVVNGSGNLVYQWKRNGNAVSNNSELPHVLNIGAVTFNDAVVCEVRTDNVCTSSPTAVSNSFTANVAYAPNNYNYVEETTVLVAGKTTESSLATLPVTEKNVTTMYYDGLGRPMQKVVWQGTPDKKDFVEPFAYDQFGRDAKKYLPFASGSTNGYYKINCIGLKNNTYTSSPQYQFYQTGTDVARDTMPFSVTVFENSPSSRVIEQGSVGAAWQPNPTQSATIKTDYKSNIAGEVQQWEYVPGINDAFGSVRYVKNYDAHTLFKTITTDEHNGQVFEFRNKEGYIVVKKIKNVNTFLCTYYIYDDFGNQRLIISPQGFASLPTAPSANYTLTADFINKWCFTYHYDGRNRLIEKKAPAAEKVRMVYDKRDRLVLTQDGVQATLNEWLYTKYDVLNRPILSGKYTDSRTLSAIQASIDGQVKWYEEPLNTGHGYTQGNCFPTNPPDDRILSIMYYDDYRYLGQSYWHNAHTGYTFLSNDLVGNSDKQEDVTGLLTGTKLKVLETNQWVYLVNYYDFNAKVIQSVSNNINNGLDRVSNKYDFTGKVIASKQHHTGLRDVTTVQTHQYDHAGRLLKAYHQTGSNTPVLIAGNTYNKLGELVTKKLHSTNNGTTFKQHIDYRYNIRGWLTRINNSDLTADNTNDPRDYFGMNLYYNESSKTIQRKYKCC
jgi:YD repeat-containing protein